MSARTRFPTAFLFALCALLALSAVAAAAEYKVDTLDNTAPGSGCEGAEACSLKGAIERANVGAGADTIKFDLAGKIKTGVNPLPQLSNPVTIDATSAPGYEAAGHPVVELNGAESGGLTTGFEVAASEVKILGFAINGFGTGIVVDGENNQICASYIGTNLAGNAAVPNKRGVEVLISAVDAQIGIGGGCVKGNVVSGNDGFGIFDEGLGTVIAGNLIGTDPTGLPLGNGAVLPLGGGVMISAQSGGAMIGAPGGGAATNTIAYNSGPGVGVEAIGLTGSIRGNSIYFNSGFGIEFGNPDLQPPGLEEVEAEVASTNVSATMSGAPNHLYEIEFFANEQCDITGGGEGQTLIGEVQVETEADGTVQFEAPLAALPPFMEVVTATATDPAITTTSAFSGCRTERPPAPALTSTAPGSGANDNSPKVVGSAAEGTTVSIYGQKNCGGPVLSSGSAAQFTGGIAAPVADNSVTEFSAQATRPFATASECSGAISYQEVTPPAPPSPPPAIVPISRLVPTNGESVAVAPEEGTVKVKRPGQSKYKPLKEGQTIPVGSIVDATNGKVLLTSVNAAGETQSAVFYGGVFLVTQHDGSGLVVLKLRGALSCAGSSAVISGKKGRKLWGSGHGNFRTEGNYGSATVRGTIWLTEDRCGGTFFKVKRGIVSVRDFGRGKTVSLPAGKSYLAKP